MSQKHQTRKFFELYQVFVVKCFNTFFKFTFIQCKAEQPLQGMGLQEKETKKD